jgi:diacylglycerol kinase
MKTFIRSVAFAANGLVCFFKHEKNGRIQLLAAISAAMLGYALKVSQHEWIWIAGCIATVLSAEMMNSAIEKTCDLVHPGYHPLIKNIKDMAAAAVLVTAIGSATVGLLIFLPKIYCLR